MADLKDEVIFIAKMLTNLQERIKDIKNNYGVNIWELMISSLKMFLYLQRYLI